MEELRAIAREVTEMENILTNLATQYWAAVNEHGMESKEVERIRMSESNYVKHLRDMRDRAIAIGSLETFNDHPDLYEKKYEQAVKVLGERLEKEVEVTEIAQTAFTLVRYMKSMIKFNFHRLKY